MKEHRNLIPFSTNPFETLCIPKSIVSDLRPDQLGVLVKQFYRSLQIVYHPDKGGDLERAADINAAYDFLTEKEDNFKTAKELYVNQSAINSKRWVREILDLEKKVEGLEKEKAVQGKNLEKKDLFIAVLKDTLLALAGLSEVPEDAIAGENLQDFIYGVTFSTRGMLPEDHTDFIRSGSMLVQIFENKDYHVLQKKRCKFYPPHTSFLAGIKDNLIPEQSRVELLYENAHNIPLDHVKNVLFALRPYLPKDGLMLLRDKNNGTLSAGKILTITPKQDFKDKKYRVI
jgi:hypothetical protein